MSAGLTRAAVNPLFQRLALITGSEAVEALGRTRAVVFGLGGVGSWCAEALVRSGLGNITIVDSDRVCESNINRQAQALGSTLGRLKTEALAERLRDINPLCAITICSRAFSKESSASFDIAGADYIIDAIDSLSCKLDLIEAALSAERCFFSSMGMARKLDPTLIRTADIWETSGCPLARLVRRGLRKRNFVRPFTVVYSPEQIPRRAEETVSGPEDFDESALSDKDAGWDGRKKIINGSAVTVTAVAGMVLASLVIRDVCARFASGVPAGGGTL